MMKRMTRGLALMLVASPLMIVACGKSDKKDTVDAGPVTTLDGSAVSETGRADAVSPADVLPTTSDGGTIADATLPSDTVLADASVVTDAPVVDAPLTSDVAGDAMAADAMVPDTMAPDAMSPDTTVVATCTETTKFTGGAVNADRTLSKACSPYTIKSDIDVNGNATLTIEPGVTLRFDPEKNIAIGYNSAAKLMAVGTASEQIVFTSSASTPGAGDWAGVQLWSNTMNGSTLKYVKFEYCGSNGDACVLGTGTKPNRVTVDHATFSKVGPGSDAIWQKDKDSNFAINNCTFSDIPSTPTQQYAISVYAPSFAGIDSTNVFNGGAMVQLMGGTVSADTTWKNINTTVAVTADVSVEGTTTPVLTIAAGSIYKFASGIEISVGYNDPGTLILAGTAAATISFSSLAGVPAAGDWLGIRLWYSATATIKNAKISYAGSDKGAIEVVSDTDKLDLQNSEIVSSDSYGIRVPCGSKAKITNANNTFTACASGEEGPGPAGDACN
jgi:hypothetical protein